MTQSAGEIDEQTLLGCIKKSRKYQEKLYKQFYGYGMSIGLRYTNSREEAKEILNDAFVKIFNSIEKFDSKQSFKAWIRRIIINTSIDHYRREAKHQNHLDLDHQTVQDLNTEAIDQLAFEDIVKLLNHLPEFYRITFNLYEVEGYSHDEIAEVLNITPSSSRVYLMRAKKRLRELFQKYYSTNNPRIPSSETDIVLRESIM